MKIIDNAPLVLEGDQRKNMQSVPTRVFEEKIGIPPYLLKYAFPLFFFKLIKLSVFLLLGGSPLRHCRRQVVGEIILVCHRVPSRAPCERGETRGLVSLVGWPAYPRAFQCLMPS